jgi:hypothetical protein
MKLKIKFQHFNEFFVYSSFRQTFIVWLGYAGKMRERGQKKKITQFEKKINRKIKKAFDIHC